MTEKEITIIPPPEDPFPEIDERRLWIGNIDTKLTEFVLLKILQKYGELDKFDYLYHKAGPDKGKPRGYCFVTYKTKKESERAQKQMNGSLILQRRLVVKWANAETTQVEALKGKVFLANKSLNKKPKVRSESTIRAIEQKLKKMENNEDDLTLQTFVKPPQSTARLHSKRPYSRTLPYKR